MSQPSHSSAAFFEAKYQLEPDPWGFECSDYERRRYDAIVRALHGVHYRSALEPGCSIGVLTEALAPFCDRLCAIDFSRTAVEQAERRCRRFRNVQTECLELGEIDTFGAYDLIILSEIGYYFSELRWKALTEKIVAETTKGCTILAAHWTGRSEDHEISGDLVHEVLLSNTELRLTLSETHPEFRLEMWERL